MALVLNPFTVMLIIPSFIVCIVVDVSSVVQAASLETVYIAIGAIGTFILLVVAILLIVILCRKRRGKMHPE